MKYPIGTHQRAGRRRRREKGAVLIILLAVLAVISSMTTWDKPEPPRWGDPSPSMIAYARNLYNMTGYCGEAKIYIDRWPEYADQIMGKE